MLKWCAAVLVCVPLVGCTGYADHELELITAARARDFCSCLFVAGVADATCEVETAREPPLVTVSVDMVAHAVEAQALLMWSARAHLVDEHVGCVLE